MGGQHGEPRIPEFIGILPDPMSASLTATSTLENGAMAGEDRVFRPIRPQTCLLANSSGSGPYVPAYLPPDDELRFRVNENYWGEAPPIANIVIDQVPMPVSQAQDASERRRRYRHADRIPTPQRRSSSSDITIETVPSLQLHLRDVLARCRWRRTARPRGAFRQWPTPSNYQGANRLHVGGEGEMLASPIRTGSPAQGRSSDARGKPRKGT